MPLLPAASDTLTLRVLLAVRVWPERLQVFWPTVAVAAVHVLPLSKET